MNDTHNHPLLTPHDTATSNPLLATPDLTIVRIALPLRCVFKEIDEEDEGLWRIVLEEESDGRAGVRFPMSVPGDIAAEFEVGQERLLNATLEPLA